MKNFQIFGLSLVAAVCLLVSSFASCKSGSPKAVEDKEQEKAFATDSIVFEEKADSALECKIVVDYPVGDDTLSVGVRNYIAQQLRGLYLPANNPEDNNAQSVGYKGSLENGKTVVDYYGMGTLDYLKEQQDELLSAIEGEAPSMSFDASIRKTAETQRYVTYECNYYTFLGGAHGSAGSHSANIVKATGEVLGATVDTTKVKAMQPILRKYVLEYLKKGGDTEVTDNNLNDYLFIENGIIPIPTFTPSLAEQGVHFVYQQYEIGPYAIGMIDFTVPYAEIKPFMTKEALELIK